MKIYLDYNAHMPSDFSDMEIKRALTLGNASAMHALGLHTQKQMDFCTKNILQGLRASNYKIIYTSGGTESNFIALNFVGKVDEILILATEHKSVINNASYPLILPVSSKGCINLDYLINVLAGLKTQNKSFLLSVALANNETGVLQNICTLSTLVRQYGGLMHTDIAQAVGKVNLDLDFINAHIYTFSGHKFGGPLGMGALLYDSNLKNMVAVVGGGGQQGGIKSGTLNSTGIYLFNQALQRAIARVKKNNLKYYALKNFINLHLPAQSVGNSFTLPNTLTLGSDINNRLQLINFNKNNICISAGSSCSSLQLKPSHVLLAMGVKNPQGFIRCSMGPNNTMEHIKTFVKIWLKINAKFNKHMQVQDNILNLI